MTSDAGPSLAYPAYILCGGASRRFGSDKARVVRHGQPQLLLLADSLRQAGHEVFFVADRSDRYADLKINCLVDATADCGPMAGLFTALNDHQRRIAHQGPSWKVGWLALVNCDQANWSSAWLNELTQAMHHTPQSSSVSPPLAAAFFAQFWQPLPALYHIDLLPNIHSRLSEPITARSNSFGKPHSLKSLLGELEQSNRCLKLMTAMPPTQWSFNTRDELAEIDQRDEPL